MRAPFVFSSIHTYPPVAIAVLFYLQFTWGSAPFPLSGGACHTLATVGRLPLSKHTGGGGATPTFSNRLVYLQLMWGSAPSPLSRAQGTPPSLLCVFFIFQLLVYYSVCFFLFSLGGGQSVQGACWFVPGLSVGVLRAAYLLTWLSASPKQVSSWRLAVQEHSWFLHLMWSGDAMCGLRVWRCQSFASSWWFFLPGISAASLQDFTLGSTLSVSSL
jgi:hypothetical protein